MIETIQLPALEDQREWRTPYVLRNKEEKEDHKLHYLAKMLQLSQISLTNLFLPKKKTQLNSM